MAVSLPSKGAAQAAERPRSGTLVRPSKWDEYELTGPSVKPGAVDRSTPT
jgi:hypothetical protein